MFLKAFSIALFELIVVLITSDSAISQTPSDWHNVSTLRLLQIVCRHGERTVLKGNIPSTDPHRDENYWPEGYGKLTNEGKYRMYKLGTYLRQHYDTYLGSGYSPREVYARSSIEGRCIESASILLAGAYPPHNKDWQWDNETELAKDWQPFPIETFMPKDDDTLLVPHKKCPKAMEEQQKITDSYEVKKFISDFHNEKISSFLENLFNESIDSLYRGQQFWDTLKIELERGLIWPQLNVSMNPNYTQEQVVDKLKEFSVWSYVHDWDTDFIHRIRLGKLIETLITNMKTIIDGIKSDNNYRLYVYSTHDTIVAPLLQALQLYDNMIPGYGATVIFELHERPDTKSYSIVIYYFNETLTGQPYKLWEQEFNDFEETNKKFFYNDFNDLCGIHINDKPIVTQMTFMVIGIGIGVGLLGLNIVLFKWIKARRHRN